jgi:hypothetical protein
VTAAVWAASALAGTAAAYAGGRLLRAHGWNLHFWRFMLGRRLSARGPERWFRPGKEA